MIQDLNFPLFFIIAYSLFDIFIILYNWMQFKNSTDYTKVSVYVFRIVSSIVMLLIVFCLQLDDSRKDIRIKDDRSRKNKSTHFWLHSSNFGAPSPVLEKVRDRRNCLHLCLRYVSLNKNFYFVSNWNNTYLWAANNKCVSGKISK